MINNLFNYATSELSQDAFLCWLMSYALKNSNKDDGLRNCTVNLIKAIIPELSCSDDEIFVTEITRQHKNIDILFTVNDEYVVIVEDKVHTSEHDDQLERYSQEITVDENYEKYEQRKVFYKTGFQSDIDNIRNAGYTFIGLDEIIGFLAPYKTQTVNQIFQDYISYLENSREKANEYKHLHIEEWERNHIFRFCSDFQKSSLLSQTGFSANYGDVSNPGGGFIAMWISDGNTSWYKNQEYELYIQLEFINGKLQLCLKVSIMNATEISSDARRQLRDYLTYYADSSNNWIYALSEFGYSRPARFGNGVSMTIGVVQVEVDSWREIENYVLNAINSFPEIRNSIDARIN